MHATLEDTPEHAARLAIILRAVSHFTTTLLFDIDIHFLIASYKHEACKNDLSTFYMACAVLVEYDIEGTLKLATPSLFVTSCGVFGDSLIGVCSQHRGDLDLFM